MTGQDAFKVATRYQMAIGLTRRSEMRYADLDFAKAKRARDGADRLWLSAYSLVLSSLRGAELDEFLRLHREMTEARERRHLARERRRKAA